MQSTLQMQYDTNFYNNILIPSGIQSHKYIFSIASNNEKYKNADLIINLAKKYNSQLPINDILQKINLSYKYLLKVV